MKCDKCGSEWKAQSNIQVKVCPFCGQKLLVETTDTVKTAMRWIVQNKGIEVLQNASLINAFLSDLAVKDEAGRKKIRMALSAGLGNDFYKCYVKVKGNVGDIEVKMLQTQLQKDGFSEEFSIYVIDAFLCSVSLPEIQYNNTDIKNNAKTIQEASISEWYIESCRKIRYLYPKSQMVEYAAMLCRLAYYRMRVPSTFEDVSRQYEALFL